MAMNVWLQQLMTPTTATGRNNPLYNADLDRHIRIATNRMVGDDPGYSEFMSRLYPNPRAGGMGAVNYGGGYGAGGGGFGIGETPAPSEASSLLQSLQRRTETNKTYPAPPMGANGKPDPRRLMKGQKYTVTLPDGRKGIYRWDGKNFVRDQ
jgi:hypothetical protein